MQLVKRLGKKAVPVVQQACSGGGFNCTANLTVTIAPDGNGYEALLVNHPTGVVNMRSNPYLPPVNVTVHFKGKVPASVAVRRVDATHGNALPVYEAMGRPQYPNASAIAALKAASMILVQEHDPVPTAGGGGWSIMLEMPIYSVASLSFSRQQ